MGGESNHRIEYKYKHHALSKFRIEVQAAAGFRFEDQLSRKEALGVAVKAPRFLIENRVRLVRTRRRCFQHLLNLNIDSDIPSKWPAPSITQSLDLATLISFRICTTPFHLGILTDSNSRIFGSGRMVCPWHYIIYSINFADRSTDIYF